MRTIRAKLLAAFLIVVFTLVQVSYFLYHSSQLTIDDYDQILRRFLLLNEITQTVRDMSKTVSIQMANPHTEYLIEYRRLKEKLLADQQRLSTYFNEPNNQLAVKNYRNIIQTYLETAEAILQAKVTDNTDRYARLHLEMEGLKRYLQEYAQSLYDIELTNYHQFYAQTLENNESLKRLSIIMIVCTAGLSVLFVIWFSTGLSRPITRLARAAQQSKLRNGVFHFQPVSVSTRDEVEILANAFNEMGRNIQHMVQEMSRKAELEVQLQKQRVENLEVNHLLKEMELKALQNQIHPHFLFNSLNVISKLAYAEGAERSSDLMVSLSNLLRYNLRRLDVPVTLGEELEHVRQYFHIQEMRFGDRITFSIEADPTLLGVTIPCLTIQPLVENAFIHGIESYEEGAEITVRVYRETVDGQERAVVAIRDNGVGMTAETMRRLMQQELGVEPGGSTKGHSTGIGLRNVIKRLMLFKKAESAEQVIHLHSAPGAGTEVRLFLPLDHEPKEATA